MSRTWDSAEGTPRNRRTSTPRSCLTEEPAAVEVSGEHADRRRRNEITEALETTVRGDTPPLILTNDVVLDEDVLQIIGEDPSKDGINPF